MSTKKTPPNQPTVKSTSKSGNAGASYQGAGSMKPTQNSGTSPTNNTPKKEK